MASENDSVQADDGLGEVFATSSREQGAKYLFLSNDGVAMGIDLAAEVVESAAKDAWLVGKPYAEALRDLAQHLRQKEKSHRQVANENRVKAQALRERLNALYPDGVPAPKTTA